MSALPRQPGPEPERTPRPYLRVYFRCANQYVRVYRRPEDPEYVARCPSCGMAKRFRVGRSGTDQRFFELSCR